MRAPKGVTFLTQILWGSIGYSVGAALGAALAGKNENRTVFLLVGDGSFQVKNQINQINQIRNFYFRLYVKKYQQCYDLIRIWLFFY
jgi:TPP-dependent 2-oxoacid decarboxylase